MAFAVLSFISTTQNDFIPAAGAASADGWARLEVMEHNSSGVITRAVTDTAWSDDLPECPVPQAAGDPRYHRLKVTAVGGPLIVAIGPDADAGAAPSATNRVHHVGEGTDYLRINSADKVSAALIAEPE
ncbi:MAG: hypothetical protein ACXIVO_13660 [Glycocaulis sp.]